MKVEKVLENIRCWLAPSGKTIETPTACNARRASSSTDWLSGVSFNGVGVECSCAGLGIGDGDETDAAEEELPLVNVSLPSAGDTVKLGILFA